MRKLAIFFGILMLALPVSAQTVSWYGAADVSMPLGDFGDVAGFGFGGALGASYPWSEQVNLRAQAGYNYYSEEITGISFASIPVMALAEYHWDAAVPAYMLAGAGITVMRTSMTILGIDVDDSSSEFGFGFGAGWSVNEQISLEGMYNLISDANHLSFQVTYGF